MTQPPILIFAQRYKAFFDATNDAIAVLNPGGELLDANPLLVQLTGHPFESLVSMHLRDIFGPHDVRLLEDIFQRILTGTPQKEPVECVVLHKKGQRRILEVSLSVLKNQYGYEQTLFAVMHDVTRRKEVEGDLLQQAEELQRVFDAVPTILLVMDERRRIRRMNRSGLATLKTTEPEVLGRRIGDALRCQHRLDTARGCGNGASCRNCAIHHSLLRATQDGEMVMNQEVCIPLAPGDDPDTQYYFKVNSVPLDTRGKRWSVVSLEDITAKKRAEIRTQSLHDSIAQSNLELKKSLEHLGRSQTKLMAAQKLEQIGLLASGLAHNLRTPLSGIKGYAQLLKSDHPDMKELAFIVDEVAIMESIINNLMLKSRKDHQKSEEVINLNDLLRIEIQFLSAHMFFKHRVKKVLEFDDHLPSIRGVYSHFSQAILNVIQNALDAMYDAEERVLTIRTRHDAAALYVEVEDTGSGIPADLMSHIFDDFFTTKPSTVDRQGDEPTGTGLGLGSANQNLRQYGGRIEIQSEPGQGTKVTLVLPRQPKAADSEVRRVLIVDDSDTMVGMLSRMCEDFGAHAFGVTDGEKALELYRRVKPHLVVSDMLMPNLTGPELMGRIREIDPEQRVIYITGYSENPEFKAWLDQECGQNGRAALLRKPFELDEFHDLLRRMTQD